MKILIVTHYFLPHMGGIEIVAYNQAKELVKLGHNVTIVSSKIGDEPEEEIIDGIKVRRIKVFNWFEKKWGVPYPVFSSNLKKILKEEIKDAEIINIHGQVYSSSSVTMKLCKKLNKKFILTQHNTYIKYKNPVFRLIETIADKTVGRRIISSASEIIAVSNSTKDYVYSIYPTENISLIYNGVDLKKFNSKRVEPKKEGSFTCFTVRRIVFKNGIDTFLEVAKSFKDNKDINFVLGGKGPDMGLVQDYIQENKLSNVNVLGFIADKDLPNYYSSSDVFILPSKTGEGFPMVVIEAFASGVPVIGTNTGGQIEVIKDNQTGFIVDSERPDAIKEKIDILMKNKNLLNKLSLNCQEIASKEFSWDNNIKRLLEIYRRNKNESKK